MIGGRYGLGILLAVSVIITLAWPLLQEWRGRESPSSLPVIDLGSTACDAAQSSCLLSVQGRLLRLVLGPRVRPLERFKVRFSYEGIDERQVQSIEVAFRMRDMDMGRNVYRLQRVADAWQADVILPVCSSGRRDWLAEVRVRADGAEIIGVFTFMTGAP